MTSKLKTNLQGKVNICSSARYSRLLFLTTVRMAKYFSKLWCFPQNAELVLIHSTLHLHHLTGSKNNMSLLFSRTARVCQVQKEVMD